jgi:hypothetical protein
MTTAGDGRAGGGYLRFLTLAAAVAVTTAALGYLPTRSLGGPRAVSGLLAACAVSWAASALGGVALLRARGAEARMRAALAATGLRLAVVAAGAGLLLASGAVPRTPLLVWLGLSYIAQLAVDTWYAVR